MTSIDLYGWTQRRIQKECGAAHSAYTNAKTAAYTKYFATHEDLRDPTHPFKAKDIAAALPTDWGGLAELIPPKLRHVHHRSGNSSQILSLGLLGAARKLDPSHAWLWEAFSPLPPLESHFPDGHPEFALDASTLAEDPDRVTSVDYFVKDEGLVMCIECKWVEAGIGSCSCKRAGGDPTTGMCRPAVRDQRPLYWKASGQVFGLPAREDNKPCPLSPVYQAVRNVAAALEMSKPAGVGVFGLLYDHDNPYFAGCGEWPGWPAVFASVLEDAHPRLRFRAASWQELLPLLPLDDALSDWAATKHGLDL